MPRVAVTVKSRVEWTPRVMQMASMFDVPQKLEEAKSWEGDLPLSERPWNIGLIVGPSGCGKSTVSRHLWPDRIVDGFGWDERSVLDNFPAEMAINDIIGWLTSVGFGSPPSWMRPFQTLSNGEQFRVTLARALATLDGLVVMDEFSSVVDRQVAKVASATVAKAVRKRDRQFVAVTCHYDVMEWLQPDWVYDPVTNTFTWRSVQPRPAMELEVCPVDRAAWRVFAPHHYLSGALQPSSQCWGGFIDGLCVAFCAFYRYPHPHAKRLMRAHRTVVLPDWQGLGISGRMTDALAHRYYEQGWAVTAVTAHPAMIAYRCRSPRWQGKRQVPKALPGNASLRTKYKQTMLRPVWSFKYVPPRGTERAPPRGRATA